MRVRRSQLPLSALRALALDAVRPRTNAETTPTPWSRPSEERARSRTALDGDGSRSRLAGADAAERVGARESVLVGSGAKVAVERRRMSSPRLLPRLPSAIMAAVLVAACGAATAKKPVEPPPEDVKAHKGPDQKPTEERGPVEAPPPAYGNRIVHEPPRAPDPSEHGASTAAAPQTSSSATSEGQRRHDPPVKRTTP